MLRPILASIVRAGTRQFHHNLKTSKRTFPSGNFYQSERHIIQQRPATCWQCGIERTNIAELFCEKCHRIQSPTDKENYFKLFEIDQRYDIDPKALRSKYRELQTVLHPDKFSTKSTAEKDISVEFSSLVNKAYDILQNDLKRAVHLLRLKGTHIDEAQRGDDPEFLMEIMELNEEVENANTEPKLIELNERSSRRLSEITKEISDAFKSNQLELVKQLVVKMRFYNSVNNHISEIMREKGIVP